VISIALPTGTLFEGAIDLLARAGIAQLDQRRLGRRLLLDHDGLRVILVRPSDVPAYVEFGAADLGVVGKDSLWESPGGHYELVDLGFGYCRLVMAVTEDSLIHGQETWPPTIRIGTKYPRAVSRYMARIGQAVEIVQLHGSVELAPQVALVDAVVDLTATGRTLRENRLRVVAEVGESTARLIANQASLKTRTGEVQAVVSRIREGIVAPGENS
jgi:ATP phosphoribosyltransferase